MGVRGRMSKWEGVRREKGSERGDRNREMRVWKVTKHWISNYFLNV